MYDLRRFFSGMFLSFSLFVSTGCGPLLLGAAVGAGSVAYIKGNVEKNFDRSFKDVHRATLVAAKKLKLYIIEDELNSDSSVTKLEFEDGRPAIVKTTAITERACKVKVRVGPFGDQEKALMILNVITKNM